MASPCSIVGLLPDEASLYLNEADDIKTTDIIVGNDTKNDVLVGGSNPGSNPQPQQQHLDHTEEDWTAVIKEVSKQALIVGWDHGLRL